MTMTTTASLGEDPQVDSDASSDFAAEYREALRKLGRFNLAVFGKTGAGKSTLVNAIFGEEVAATGVGKPVTQATTYHEHPSGIFGMFDCVGFETGESGDAILAALSSEVLRRRTLPMREQMHVAWYVLRWSDRRFDNGQADFVRALHRLGLPVVFVLSQVPLLPSGDMPRDAKALADTIRDEVGGIIVGGAPVFTNARYDDEFGHQVHGLQDLLDATFQAAPEGVRGALVASQRIDLERKRGACRLIIGAAGVTAGGIGASPIPFSDAALLVPAQVTMMTAIAAQYALPITAAQYAQLAATATLASGGLSLAGRGLANIAKLIPGVGTVVGGAINATIASTLTVAIGRAWMAVCDYLNGMSPEQIEAVVNTGDKLNRIFLSALKSGGAGWAEGLAGAA